MFCILLFCSIFFTAHTPSTSTPAVHVEVPAAPVVARAMPAGEAPKPAARVDTESNRSLSALRKKVMYARQVAEYEKTFYIA